MGEEKYAKSSNCQQIPCSVDLDSVVVRPIEPHEADTWDHLMSTHHYLGFQNLVGESLKYVAVSQGQWLALLGWGAAALQCRARDQWIGWTREQQWKRLKFIVNNQRFLILPGVRVPNLASKILSLNTRRLASDWKAVYGHPVVLAETFVDPKRFAGTCYRAAGWIPLGQTRGFGRNGGRYFAHGHPKTLLVRPLHPRARDLLAAPFLAPELKGVTSVVDLNLLPLEEKGGLLERLEQVTDPRKRRGIRHSHVSILAIAICACLAGARSFVAIAEWAADLGQDLLRKLRCRRDPKTGRYVPPSEPTIRRVLQSVDADEVDRIVGDWLADQCDDDAVAVDGKTLRGSKRKDGKPVHLIAALLHNQGVVLSQTEVDSKSNEITAFEPLLDPIDLQGKVVTADAMHLQAKHAHYLKTEKQADYLFTVKANQPGILQAIEELDDDDFSPSGD